MNLNKATKEQLQQKLKQREQLDRWHKLKVEYYRVRMERRQKAYDNSQAKTQKLNILLTTWDSRQEVIKAKEAKKLAIYNKKHAKEIEAARLAEIEANKPFSRLNHIQHND